MTGSTSGCALSFAFIAARTSAGVALELSSAWCRNHHANHRGGERGPRQIKVTKTEDCTSKRDVKKRVQEHAWDFEPRISLPGLRPNGSLLESSSVPLPCPSWCMVAGSGRDSSAAGKQSPKKSNPSSDKRKDICV